MSGRLAPPWRPRFGTTGLAGLVALGLAAVVLLLARLLLGLVSYPLAVSSPEAAGVVATKSTDQFDAPEVRLVLTTGVEVILRRNDRSLIGGVGEGDLIVVGSTPERWFVSGSPARRASGPDCYAISADRAYSEADGIVLVWGAWLGQGVRLPKGPGYDDGGLVDEIFGHLAYRSMEVGSGVSFCLDAEGRVTEFTH